MGTQLSQESCSNRQVKQIDSNPTAEDLVKQFPTVFDGHIHTMEGEKFHISLVDDTVPFCIKAPRSIPFAYRDKLKVEIEIFQEQGIIAPMMQVTE